MINTRAPSLYGLRTVLSGTLLPARPIATAFPHLAREIVTQGHEVIVHAWDHRKWQDNLQNMNRKEIEQEYQHAFEAHRKIFGEIPHATASPGWQATPTSLDIEDGLELEYASDMREGRPAYPKVGDRIFSTLQIPATGPCLEELLSVGIRENERMAECIMAPLEHAVQPVITLHAEVEGGIYNSFLEKFLLPSLLQRHYHCITLREAAKRIVADEQPIPVLELTTISLAGRADPVASLSE
jgi:peptidoglycan/xylan/chitin deacetylase (PgdA/CDA1 family)